MQTYCVQLIEKLIVELIDLLYRRACYQFINIGERYTLDQLQNIEFEMINGFHIVKSVGYGFNTITDKLKPELLELVKTDKYKFIDLKHKYESEGITTTIKRRVPQMLYYGDTNITALIKYDEWEKVSSYCD